MSTSILELSWQQIENLDKDKTVLVLSIAPIEQHGLHLPIGVDIYETEYWVKESIKKLEVELNDYKFYTLPIIPFGNADIRGFIGNIHLSQRLLYKLVMKTVKSLAEWKLKNIIIISGHADPKHLIAIEQVCDKINKKNNDIVFSPMGAIFSKKINSDSLINNEFIENKLKLFPNDFHAGWIETSIMLDIKNHLVNSNYINQPDIEIKDMQMIFPNFVKRKIKGYGHIGYPKESSSDLGHQLNIEMISKICFTITKFILRDNYKYYSHHELFKIPFMKSRPWRFN